MYIGVLYVPHCLPLTIPIVDGMNDLQHISEEIYGPVLVTLNPPMHPQADKVIGRYDYAHPVLNAEVEINILIASSCLAVSLISFPFFFAIRLYSLKVRCRQSKVNAVSRLPEPGSDTDSTRMVSHPVYERLLTISTGSPCRLRSDTQIVNPKQYGWLLSLTSSKVLAAESSWVYFFR